MNLIIYLLENFVLRRIILFRIIKNFSILDFKNTFFRKSFFLMEFLTIYLTVLIYYYSAKAFIPNENLSLNFYGADFFSYLLFGDLVLRIPQYLFYSPIRNIKKSIQENTFESMTIFGGSLKKIILGLSLMEVAREIFSSFLMLSLALYFFGLQISALQLIQSMIFIIVSLPFFLGVGLIISSLVIWIEKGESFLYYLCNIMAILAGVYFPVEVFPKAVQYLGALFSPFYLFLKYNRMILSGESIPSFYYLFVLIASSCFLFLGLKLVELSIFFKRKQGTLFVT